LAGFVGYFGAVLFGIGAIREEAQRGLMHPASDAIGCRPDLLITNNGAVKRRFFCPAAEVNPCGDTAGWWLVLECRSGSRSREGPAGPLPRRAASVK